MAIKLEYTDENTGLEINNAYARINEIHVYNDMTNNKNIKVGISLFTSEEARKEGKTPVINAVTEFNGEAVSDPFIKYIYNLLMNEWALSNAIEV